MTAPRVDLSVYLVTDATLAGSRRRGVADTVALAVAGGVTAVQVREKDAPAAGFLDTVLQVAQVLPDGVALLVNDRVDVFLAARAAGARVAGVHVGQTDLPVVVVRELVGAEAVIGVSAATAAQLVAAEEAGADYVGIGVLRATSTKTDTPPPLGVAGFARLAEATGLPAVAIGGVTAADLAPVRLAGGAGVAIVSGICAAEDPRSAAESFAAAWAAAA